MQQTWPSLKNQEMNQCFGVINSHKEPKNELKAMHTGDDGHSDDTDKDDDDDSHQIIYHKTIPIPSQHTQHPGGPRHQGFSFLVCLQKPKDFCPAQAPNKKHVQATMTKIHLLRKPWNGLFHLKNPVMLP